jgi:hypothetical protein
MWFVKVPNRGRRYTSRYGTPVAARDGGFLPTSDDKNSPPR